MGRRKLTEEEKKLKAFKEKILTNLNSIKRSLKDVKRLRIPDPSYIHSIGDRVIYGRWKWTGILEVLDNGKIYKCFSVTYETKRNVPDSSRFQIHYLPWYDALPYQTEFPEILQENNDIDFNYQQRDISSLLYEMFDEFGIDLNPDYQRGNVWSLQQKVDLIHSVFQNIDIGKFTVIKRPWGPNSNVPITPLLYEMLDGKQRLTAIYEFFIGKFEYKGKYFHELNPRDKNHFKHYKINYAESEPLTNEQKYRYFLKLNVSGVPMKKEHLRKVTKMWLDSKRKDS